MKTARHNKHFANAICRARKKMGMSQRDLANRLGVSQPTVLRWERGVEPAASMVGRIAVELQVPMHELDPSYPETGITVAVTPTDVLEEGLLKVYRQLPPKGKRLTEYFLETLAMPSRMNERSRKAVAQSLLAYDEPSPWLVGELDPDERSPSATVQTLSATLGDLKHLEVDLINAFREMDRDGRRELLAAVEREMKKVVHLRRHLPVATDIEPVSQTVIRDSAARILQFIDAAAGAPLDASSTPEEVEVPAELAAVGNLALARARGDSMSGIGINDRDVLLVEVVSGTRNYSVGDIVVARLDDSEYMVKRYGGTRRKQRIFLSENEGYQPRHADTSRSAIEAVVLARRTLAGEWVEVPGRRSR